MVGDEPDTVFAGEGDEFFEYLANIQNALTILKRKGKTNTEINKLANIYDKQISWFSDSIMISYPAKKHNSLVNLLVDIMQDEMNSCYVTKNTAPREVFYKKLKGGEFKVGWIKNIFKGMIMEIKLKI